jgi:exopolyphosphatase/guanosine-5'-triphosphate,3'-diphosphate pyrophosphatase
MRLAVIDLGTNSVRFEIFDISPDLEPEGIYREKQMVRLGDGVFLQGCLNKRAKERGFRAFGDFFEKIQSFEVKRTIAFATCALREAQDRQEFVDAVEERTGIKIKIISGEEEARLIAKGILSNENLPHGIFALVDIGGGSTEISLCHKKNIVKSYSFNLGANRLEQVFLKTVPPQPTPENRHPIQSLREHIRKELKPLVKKNDHIPIKTLIGSSGTVRAYKRIIKKTGEMVEPYDKDHLSQLVKAMSTMDLQELLSIPGIESKRADIILSGGILLEEIMNVLKTRWVFTSEFNLRDGILEQELEKLAKDKV